MTLFQVHFLMLGLGILACLFVAGSSKSRAGYPGGSRKSNKPWGLALLAGLVVAASPLSRFWRTPIETLDLLTQSLLVAAIGLLALLLFAMLRRPKRSVKFNETNAIHSNGASAFAAGAGAATASLTPILIDAERGTERGSAITAQSELNEPQNIDYSDIAITIDKSSPSNTETTKTANASTTETIDATEAINVTSENTGSKEIQEELDLSATGQLYAEVRDQKNEVELPDVNDWTADVSTNDDAILDENLVLKNETAITQRLPNSTAENETLRAAADQIEDAEMIEESNEQHEQTLKFANQLSGDYARPFTQEASVKSIDTNVDTDANLDTEELATEPVLATPNTLDEALQIAKRNATELHEQVEALESGIADLSDLQASTLAAESQNRALQEEANKEKDNIIEAEDKARVAAEAVISVQSALIKKSQKQQEIINTLLHQERLRLATQQQEIERSREMARKATNLARKAATAQHAIRDIARKEQTARLKSQEATRKAVVIARNAISALAKEEQKRGITRH